MILPKLKINPDKPRVLETCQGKDYCSTCSLSQANGGRCSGCTPLTKMTLEGPFKSCYQMCNECSQGHKVNVTAICCRSPLKDIYLQAVTRSKDYNNPKLEIPKKPKLFFKRKAILNFVFGSAERLAPGESILFPDHEVQATNLSYVKGMGDNFYSTNLKHYIKLKQDAKLILTTMSIDDHLERAWEKEQYGGSFYSDVKIDYWTPMAFSTYGHEAKMFQYYQFLRTLYSAEMGGSWFTLSTVPRERMKIDDLLAQWLEACPQVMFNAQFIRNDEDIKVYMQDALWWNKFAPDDVPFWFVGPSTPLFMHNIRKVVPHRDVYWISSKPVWAANSGKVHRRDGGEAKAPLTMSKKELLFENMRTFEEIVKAHG